MGVSWLHFFFFQAEDGIRDVAVTGVQTCALPISRPTRRRGFFASNVDIYWGSPAEALPEPMRSAQGANAKSGCFGSRNSPPASYATKPRFLNHQNRVRSDLAVPAEKRRYVVSARIIRG